MSRVAAVLFAAISACVVLFQLALALGAPLGEYAMGGAFPGRYPPGMRAAAVVQGALIALMASIVLARAGIVLQSWARASKHLVWFAVALGALGLVLNLATPSTGERAVWAPIAAVLLASSLVVAVSRPDTP